MAASTKPKGGLTKWFKEDWVDIKTGKQCGRQKGENRDYPACRPAAVAAKMTKKEKATASRQKQSSKPIEYAVTASGKRRQPAAMGGYTDRWAMARGGKAGPSLSVGRGEKLSVEEGGGLTAKGRAKYNSATGSNLQAPVTGDNPTGKDAARKKSFCARSSGWTGERGKAARKRWNC